MIRLALLLWAALMLAMSASAQMGIAPPSGFIVAATQGQTSVTGTTAETNLANFKIPANTMGKNGHIEIKTLMSYTNSANNKTLLIRLSSSQAVGSGGLLAATTQSATATMQAMAVYRNNNATNSQIAYGAPIGQPFSSSTSASVTSAIDTTQDAWVNISGQLGLGTETLTLVHAYAVVFPAN